MNGRLFFLIVLVMGVAVSIPGTSYCETYVSGDQSGVWSIEDSPFIVIGDVTIPTDSMLTIEAGVEVLFEGTHRIFTDGGLILAVGTETDSITFVPASGYPFWGSIHILNTPITKPAHFQYCLFENADGAPENNRWGGAFYTQYGYITFENCSFLYNYAYTGAAIFGHLSTVTFNYCELFHNSNDWKGGAINFNTGTVDFNYTAICNNSAVYEAGGVYAWLGDLNFTNCTIAHNSAGNGGGIFNYPGSTTIDVVNCIIYGNIGGNITGPGYSNVSYSDIGGGWPGMGNIDANPMFVDPGNDDFHLLANSPCIDAGDPTSPPDPDATIADMGAYYFDQPGWQPGNLLLYLEPVNPPIVIPSQGGSFDYTAAITCDLTGYAVFDAWTELVLPNGQTMGPLILRENLFMAAGDSIFRELEMYVSAWAMPGIYELHGYLGNYPDSVLATDWFEFEKESTDGFAPGSGGAWATLSGWGDRERIDLPSQQTVATSTSQHLKVTCTPNPFNPETVLQFNLPAAGKMELTIYDLSGRLVATLLDRHLDGGSHSVTFDGSRLASGIYLAVAAWDNQLAASRLLLLK